MSPAKESKEKPGRVLLRRVAWIGGALAVGLFTIEGGEYGTRDLWTQKGRKAKLDAEVAQLRLDVDSLRAEYKVLTTDNARLERIAREEFGMVRGGKELLYWVGNGTGGAADTVGASADTTSR
jgi:cell division protein FtsB